MNTAALLANLLKAVMPLGSDASTRCHALYRNRLGIDEYLLRRYLAVPQVLYRLAYLFNEEAYCKGLAKGELPKSRMVQYEPTLAVSLSYEVSIQQTAQELGISLTTYAASPNQRPLRPTDGYIPGHVEVAIINHRNTELFEANTTALATCEHTERATNAEEIRLTTTPGTHVRIFKTTPPNDHKTTYHILTIGLNCDVIKRFRHILFMDAIRAIENKAQTVGAEGRFEASLVHLTRLLCNEEHITLTNNWVNTGQGEPAIVEKLFGAWVATIIEELESRQRARIIEAINRIPDTRLQNAERRLISIKHEVEAAERTYKELMEQFENTHNQYYAIKYSEEDTNKEIKQFLESLGTKLKDVWTSDGSNVLNVIADNECKFFDPRLLNAYINNPRSELRIQPIWVYNFIIDVFYRKKYKLKMTVGFKINLSSGSVEKISESYNSPLCTYNSRTGLPNPHHEFYNCWGDNKIPIREAINRGNIAEALMIAYAATAGIKLSDTAVFSKMLQYLTHASETVMNRPCLIAEDGTALTIRAYKAENNAERISVQ